MDKYLKDIDRNKLEKVFEIKNRYNNGELSFEDAKKEINNTVDFLAPHEIAWIEQKLKEFEDEECQKEDIQGMLDIFEDVMQKNIPDLPRDHPIKNYYRENEELEKILLSIEDLVQYPVIKNQWLEIYEKLEDYRIHLSRKQNQLYPVLEKKGFDRPTTTMWTLDDFIRDEIKKLFSLLKSDSVDEFIDGQLTLVADMRDLKDKENTILYPTALKLIDQAEFEEMKSGDREIGYAWIDVEKAPSKITSSENSSSNGFKEDLMKLLSKYGYNINSSEKLDVAQGKLSLEQINLIYKHMPVDLSYVDENEIVCFYTDTEHRVFPRSKNVIGRDVKNCHPRKSVHLVEEIVEKFRSGEQDSAEFWIDGENAFIYIYYVAVRDSEGKFRGVLEMMQDCTHIRSLKGSRTLLTWDNENSGHKNKSSEPESKESGIETTDIKSLNADTKLKALLDLHPWLKDELPNINPAFQMLKTPLARVMIPKAKLSDLSQKSGMELNELIEKINLLIKERDK